MELNPETVRYGYELGCFPMALENGRIEWFRSLRRCLFPIEGIRVSRSLSRKIRKNEFDVTFDVAFESVMRHCLRPDDNWINDEIIRVYTEIHHQGWGHSCEVWRDGVLVGGVYGLALGACFCAESMFHRETDASKIALFNLVEKCRDLGFSVFDAQIMNPHLASLGAYEVSPSAYMRLLQECLRQGSEWDVLASREPGKLVI
jgi:leucyl/phenylalanyl-tRNA--protein transferase